MQSLLGTNILQVTNAVALFEFGGREAENGEKREITQGSETK